MGDLIRWAGHCLCPMPQLIQHALQPRSKIFDIGNILAEVREAEFDVFTYIGLRRVCLINYNNENINESPILIPPLSSCNTTNHRYFDSTPPTRVTLTAPGEHFFFTCTVPSHCSLGQQLAINVSGTSSPTPSPSPIATPPSTSVPSATSPACTGGGLTPSTTPGNSATSIGVTCLTFLSIPLAILYHV